MRRFRLDILCADHDGTILGWINYSSYKTERRAMQGLNSLKNQQGITDRKWRLIDSSDNGTSYF